MGERTDESTQEEEPRQHTDRRAATIIEGVSEVLGFQWCGTGIRAPTIVIAIIVMSAVAAALLRLSRTRLRLFHGNLIDV